MENEIGKRYGKLTVIEKLDRREHNTSVYLCINVTGEKNVSLQLHALLMAMLFPVVVETKRIKQYLFS